MREWLKSKTVWSAIIIALISIYKMFLIPKGWPNLPDEVYGLPAALGLYGLRSAIATQPPAPERQVEQATAPAVDAPRPLDPAYPLSPDVLPSQSVQMPAGFRPLLDTRLVDGVPVQDGPDSTGAYPAASAEPPELVMDRR